MTLQQWKAIFPETQTQNKQRKQQNEDQSVYSDDPRDTEEDDMEEDLGLLENDDMGW
jgi:hypothetical protein